MKQLVTTQNKIEWFMLVRLAIVSGVLCLLLYFYHTAPYAFTTRIFSILFSVIIFSYILILCYGFLLNSNINQTIFVSTQIVFDIFFVTLLVLMSGVVRSAFTFLYLLIIVISSLTLSIRGAIISTSLSVIAYSTLIFVTQQISSADGYSWTIQLISYSYCIDFLIVGILSGVFAEQIKTTTHELIKKTYNIKKLEDLNQLILDSMSSGLMLVMDNSILSINKAVQNIFGYKTEMLVGKKISEIFPAVAKIVDNLKTSHSPNQLPLVRRTIEMYKHDKSLVHIGVSVMPFQPPHSIHFVGEKTIYSRKTQEGLINGNLILLDDLTEVVKLEGQLRQAEKMIAIGDMAAGMAHEIRNPLASMSGSVEILKQNKLLLGEDKKLLEIIIRETDRLNQLMDDFLNYARRSEFVHESVELHALIEETNSFLKMHPDAPKKMIITSEGESQLWVDANSNLLKQVFMNIFINAFQARRENVDLVIKTKLYSTPLEAYIDISDNGFGIDLTNIKRIFDPFFTTKANGTGLGLAIVYKNVSAMGGHVSVQSEKGLGTTITVTLPRSNSLFQIHQNVTRGGST